MCIPLISTCLPAQICCYKICSVLIRQNGGATDSEGFPTSVSSGDLDSLNSSGVHIGTRPGGARGASGGAVASAVSAKVALAVIANKGGVGCSVHSMSAGGGGSLRSMSTGGGSPHNGSIASTASRHTGSGSGGRDSGRHQSYGGSSHGTEALAELLYASDPLRSGLNFRAT